MVLPNRFPEVAARIVAAHITRLRCTTRDATRDQWGQEEEEGEERGDDYNGRWERAIRLSLDPSITHNTKTLRAVEGIFDLLLGVSTDDYDSGSLGGEGRGEDGEGGLLPTAADRDTLLCIAASIRTAPSFHMWTQLCLLHGTGGRYGWTFVFQYVTS